jgi:hypothetical protein
MAVRIFNNCKRDIITPKFENSPLARTAQYLRKYPRMGTFTSYSVQNIIRR